MACLAAFPGAVGVVSAQGPAQAPAQGSSFSRPAQSLQTYQFALSNGMQVLVIPDHRAPVVTQMLWFKVGGVDDPPGISGLAHFFEHMMFRGTRKVPGDLFTQTVSKNGGETNAFTSHDYTAYYEQIAKDRLPLVMELEADRLTNLILTDDTVLTERNVVLEERRARVDNDPQALWQEQMQAALHLSHPYGRPIIGWPDEMRRIDRLSAQAFYRRHYAPNNAVLVVAGDVTPDEVRRLAQQYYGPIPARRLEPRAEYAEPQRLAETRLSITRADARVPIFSRIYRVASYAQAAPGGAEALEVYGETLGASKTGLLYRVLVEQKKVATEAGASYDGFNRDAGQFAVYAVPRPGVTLAALERAVDEVLRGTLGQGPGPKELARAKTELVADTIYRRDSQMAMARAYGLALTIGLTVDDVNAWPARIRRVGANDVREAARSLSRKEAVTGYLLPGGGK